MGASHSCILEAMEEHSSAAGINILSHACSMGFFHLERKEQQPKEGDDARILLM